MKAAASAALKDFKRVTDSAIAYGGYAAGIAEAEPILVRHPELRTPGTLHALGLLYDHRALELSKKSEQRALERKAESLYQEALGLDAHDVNSLWGLARIHWHHQDSRALPLAEKAYAISKRHRGHGEIMAFNVGLVHESLGDYTAARRWFLKSMPRRGSRLGHFDALLRVAQAQDNKRVIKEYRTKLARSLGQQRAQLAGTLLESMFEERLRI